MPKMPRAIAMILPAGTIKASAAPVEGVEEAPEEEPEELDDPPVDEAPPLVAVAEEEPDEVELPVAAAAALEVLESNLNIPCQ